MKPQENGEANAPQEFEKRTMPVHWQKDLAADLSQLEANTDEFSQILESVEGAWYDEDALSEMRLGYIEALTNAIKYGSNSNIDAKIAVSIDIDARRVMVTLTDTNPEPFEKESAFSSVTNPEQLLAEHGRGITMMDAYYPDGPNGVSFEFMNPGNKVTMIRNRK